MHIPSLNRKLRLLRERGGFESLAALAKIFGVKESTLQWWEHGDSARPPNTLPDKHLAALIGLVERCLPETADTAQAAWLVTGPYADFARAFEAYDIVTLDDLVTREGIFGRSRLILKPEARLDLIETDHAPPAGPDHRAGVGQWFRLVFEGAVPNSQALALILSDGACRIVASAVVQNENRILVPGLKIDGQPAHLRETAHASRWRVLLFQTPAPFPAMILAAARDGATLDATLRSNLAAFFLAQHRGRRRLHVADVEITA